MAFNNPAWQASVRDFVGKDLLPGAVLLNGVGFNVTRSVAPAIGGTIVAVAGVSVAFLVNALSYLGLIFAVGVALGIAKNDGVSALAATVGYLVMTATIGTVAALTDGAFVDEFFLDDDATLHFLVLEQRAAQLADADRRRAQLANHDAGGGVGQQGRFEELLDRDAYHGCR